MINKKNAIRAICGIIAISGIIGWLYSEYNKNQNEVSQPTSEQNIGGISYFFNSLEPEELSKELLNDSIDDYWLRFFNCQKDFVKSYAEEDQKMINPSILSVLEANIVPPVVWKMLKFPLKLPDGTIVKETYPKNKQELDGEKNIQIGRAYCKDGELKIMYAIKWEQDIDSVALAFFRFHEFAHHLLKHTTCLGGKGQNHEAEKAADCMAAKLLLQFPDGIRVFENARARFYYLDRDESLSHPSFRSRADNLYLPSCGL